MRLLGMRVSEWTIHGWDLARVLDIDDSLQVAPRVKTLAATGYFRPPAGLPDTAPVQDRLLDLLGRHPSSPPASYSERA